MNNQLSICIPTYNRSEYLSQCLTVLLREAAPYSIPVFIMDNASTDNTFDIVEQFKLKYSHIFYSKQSKNVPLDANMLDVVKLSNTRFSWLLGDDDFPKDGAVAGVIEILTKNPELELLILEGTYISNDLQKTYTNLINLEKPTFYSCTLEFFRKHHEHTPFGNIILKTQLFKLYLSDKYFGTSHAYSGVIYDYLASEYEKNTINKILVTEDPMVFLRCGKKSWESYATKVFFNDIPLWYERLPGIYLTNTNVFRNYLKQQSKYVILMNLKSQGKLGSMYQSRLYNHFSFFQKMKVHFIFYCIPISIINSLRVLRACSKG